MKPGSEMYLRELDVLIANKVMNLPDVRLQEQGYHVDLVYGPNGMRGTAQQVPHYSTDIGRAWEVVERLRELKPIDFKLFWNGEVTFAEFDDRQVDTRSNADTAPEAICLAALRSLEVDIDYLICSQY